MLVIISNIEYLDFKEIQVLPETVRGNFTHRFQRI